jgi:diguanylate cyclase (GGDEF)-like protein
MQRRLGDADHANQAQPCVCGKQTLGGQAHSALWRSSALLVEILLGPVEILRMRGAARRRSRGHRKQGWQEATAFDSLGHNDLTVSHELPSQTNWITRISRTLVQLGYVPSLMLVTMVLVPISALVSPLLVLLLGTGSPLVAAQVGALSALVLVPSVGALVLRLLFQLERARARLAVLATQDALTGIHNRRYFFEIAEREWQRSKRYGEDSALLLIDADNFKSINDLHGHMCGDKLLVAIARAVRATLRTSDLMARFGGEELVILLPHTDPLGALDVAERIRERVAGGRLDWHGEKVGITVSVGVASYAGDDRTLDALVHDADLALYAAKKAGRNCVRAAPIRPRRSGEAHRETSK